MTDAKNIVDGLLFVEAYLDKRRTQSSAVASGMVVCAINYIRQQEQRERDCSATARSLPVLHHFNPHKRYPWFCADCGYAPHEPLKHFQTAERSGAAEEETPRDI